MANIKVAFAIRLRSKENFPAISRRVSHVLNCEFIADASTNDRQVYISKTDVACLQIRLSRWPFYDDPKLWLYQLVGANVIEPRWDYVTKIKLTDWMLQEFHARDSRDWYVPTIEEWRGEGGVADTET
jgi:hypothetical protein